MKFKIGDKVIFDMGYNSRSYGIVTSSNDKFVFVKFNNSLHPQACNPQWLRRCYK